MHELLPAAHGPLRDHAGPGLRIIQDSILRASPGDAAVQFLPVVFIEQHKHRAFPGDVGIDMQERLGRIRFHRAESLRTGGCVLKPDPRSRHAVFCLTPTVFGDKQDLPPRLFRPAERREHALRIVLRFRDQEQFPPPGVEVLGRDHHARDLMFFKHPHNLLALHAAGTIQPFHFRIVEHCGLHDRCPTVEQTGRLLHLPKEPRDHGHQRVFPSKVRGRVRVRERLQGEGMRGKVVDAPGEEEVCEIAHLPDILLPAVGAEDFTQRPPLLLWINQGGRKRHLRQHMPEEAVLGLKVLRLPGVVMVPGGGFQFMEHQVHAGHGLARDRAEIMPGPLAQAGMRVVLFNHVPDIFQTVRLAPRAKRPAVVFRIQPGDRIHQGKAHIRGPLPAVIPERGKPCACVPTERFFQDVRQIHAPRNREHRVLAEDRVGSAARSERRFIGEKAQEGCPARIPEKRCMRRINRLNHEPRGIRQERVEEFLRRIALGDIARGQHKDAPGALRNIPADHPVLHPVRQVQKIPHGKPAQVHK